MCFYNDDGGTHLATVYRKANKSHLCEDCGQIAKGQIYRHSTGEFEGDICTYKACGICELTRYVIHLIELSHGCHWFESWCYEELISTASEYEVPFGEDFDSDAATPRYTVEEGQRFLKWQQRNDAVRSDLLAPKQ